MDIKEDSPIPKKIVLSTTDIIPDDLRDRTARLAKLGDQDPEATKVFRHYVLPEKLSYRVDNGLPEEHGRALLDPNEFVILINSDNKMAGLIEMVNQDHTKLKAIWQSENMGEPPRDTSLEVIVGDPDYPETCYRYKVFDITPTNKPNTYTASVRPNIVFERNDLFIAKPHSDSEPPLAQIDQSDQPANEPPIALVDPSSYTDSQLDIMEKIDPRTNLAYGMRTGEQTSHQREVPGRTVNFDLTSDIEVNIKNNPIWVVAENIDQQNEEQST